MGEVENAPEIPVVAFPAIVTDRADAPAGLPSFPSMVQKRPQDFSEVPWNTLPISIAACWSRRHYWLATIRTTKTQISWKLKIPHLSLSLPPEISNL